MSWPKTVLLPQPPPPPQPTTGKSTISLLLALSFQVVYEQIPCQLQQFFCANPDPALLRVGAGVVFSYCLKGTHARDFIVRFSHFFSIIQ